MILIVLVIAFILRLITLDQSLWLDEAININAAKELGFWHYVTGYPIGDFHPPGFFVILWIWGYLFGFSEQIIRLPSVVMGVLTVWLTFLIGKELFDKRIGLIGALLLTFSPLHVYYSQEARMYSFSALAVTFSCYSFLGLLNNRKYSKIWYPLSIILLLYSDYLAYLILPVQFLYVILFYRFKIKEYLVFSILGGLSILPWLLVFPIQLINGRATAENVPGWERVVGGGFKNALLVYIKAVLGRVTLADKNFYFSIIGMLGVIYVGVYSLALKRIDRKILFLLGWGFLPVLIGFLVSFYIPVLAYFRMVFVLPAVYLIMGVGINRLKGEWLKQGLYLIVSISIIFLLMYYANPIYQRENWKGFSEYINNNLTSEDIVLFENNDQFAPYKYYDKQKVQVVGALANFPASKEEEDIVDLEKLVSGKKRVYLLNYLVDISDPARLVDKKLTSLGFEVKKAEDFPSLGILYEYAK